MPHAPTSDKDPAPPPKEPWPLSWVLIVILLYILFQTAYFLFLSD